MYIAYLDDAGNTGNNYADANQPYHAVLGVLIPEKDWAKARREFLKVIEKYFPGQSGEFLAGSSQEIHGSEIMAGKGIFKGFSKNRRLDIFKDIIAIVTNFKFPICGTYVEKAVATTFHEELIQNKVTSGEVLFVGTCGLIDDMIQSSYGARRALVIGDVGQISPLGADTLEDIVAIHNGRLIESARILESHRSFGVQIADILNYLFVRNMTKGEQAVKELVSSLNLTISSEPGSPGSYTVWAGWNPKP